MSKSQLLKSLAADAQALDDAGLIDPAERAGLVDLSLLNEDANTMNDEPIEVQLSLPGEPRSGLIPVANTYRVTIERDDGYQLTEHEARTVLQIAAEPKAE